MFDDILSVQCSVNAICRSKANMEYSAIYGDTSLYNCYCL